MKQYRILAGSYADASQDSLLLCTADFEQQTIRVDCGTNGLTNPSYLARRGELLYAVEETDNGQLAVLRQTPDGFRLLQRCSTGGATPCHLTLDTEGGRIAVSNYAAQTDMGSVTVFQLDEAGLICEQDTIKHTGCGINPIRQKTAHLHYAQFLPQGLLACDLGLDQLHLYTLDGPRIVSDETAVSTTLGSGPRHFCTLPGRSDWIYVLCELDARVRVYHWKEGQFRLMQTIDSLPDGTTEEARSANIAAAIKTDGSYVFVTNRGFDAVTAFSITENCLLQKEDFCTTGSQEPRDLLILDQYLLMGHDKGHAITAMEWDAQTKTLRRLPMSLQLPVSPVFLMQAD